MSGTKRKSGDDCGPCPKRAKLGSTRGLAGDGVEVVAFFGDDDPLSNWYNSGRSFSVIYPCGGEARVRTAEHGLMIGKALVFGDVETRQKIEACRTPKAAKALGRKVRGFSERVWEANREVIMDAVLGAKFASGRTEHASLMLTKGARIVEASKYDKVWGTGRHVGSDEQFAYRHDPARANKGRKDSDPTVYAPGRNLLGLALERTRDKLNV